MTDEQWKKMEEVGQASHARENRRRAGTDIHYTSRSEQAVNKSKKEEEKEVSHNAVAGTVASVGVGAREGVKNTIFNGKAFIQTDLGAGRATALQTADRAVRSGVDYDAFIQEMSDKYGKNQTFWAIRMTPDERDLYASVLQARKLGLTDVSDLDTQQAQAQIRQDSIDAERRLRSQASQAALQAVDDKYELGKIGEFAQDIGASAGQMLPSLAVGMVNPAAGLATMGLQTGLQGYGQALDAGADHTQAARYGALTAAKDVAIERLTGGLGRFYGRGVLDDVIRMRPNNTINNVLLNTAKGMAGEGAEEALGEFVDPYLQRVTYDSDAQNATASELAYQAALGAALGGMIGGASNAAGYVGSRARQVDDRRVGTDIDTSQIRSTAQHNAENATNNGFSSHNISADELTVKYNPANSPYEQAMDSVLKGEDSSAARAETEDERATKRFIQTAAVNARLDVRYDDMPLSRKAYYKDGVIHINKNRPLSDSMKTTVAHEMYHALEGTKEHDMIANLALKSAGDGAVQAKIESYGKYGISLDENGARAEIGAEFIEKALTDEATINQVLLESRGGDFSLVRKIIERIKDMVAVYRAKKSMSAEDAAEYAALLKAQRLYEDGLAKLHEGKYEPASGERNARYQSERLGGYFPNNEVSVKDVEQYKIKNINNKYEVIGKLKQALAKTYLSTENQSKPITNLDTGMEIEIRQGGINETFGKDDYYLKLSNDEKLAKIATMSKLANLIKYGEVRTEEAANYHNPNSKVRYAYLTAPIKVDGKEYIVNMDIRKSPNGENRFYIHSLDIKKDAESLLPSMRVVKGEKQTSTNNIPNSTENVNSKSVENEKNSNERYAIDESVDSDGNALSEEQAEYFKDSKVRDKGGRLQRVYHNTNADFTVFDVSKSGSNQGTSLGDGIYLSKSKSVFADSDYGDKQMVMYANITKPFNIREDGLTSEQADYVLEKYASAKHDLKAYDGIYAKHAKSKLMSSSRVMDYLKEYASDNDISTIDIFTDLGYDGIFNGMEIVAFDPNQVKNIDNASPTDDSDIRYSVDDVSVGQGSGTSGDKVGYRFFDNTFQNTPIFDDAVKEIERSYEHERTRVSEKENIEEARRRLKENGWHKEINTVLKKGNVDGADTDVAMAIISQLNNYETDSAEFGRIMKFAEDYADKTVESGQFIQSLAKYSRTPVGKTEKAMRDVKREERELQKKNPKQWNNAENKASKARKAYKKAQEEAATEATEDAINKAVDSMDVENVEKIVNEDNSAERLATKIKAHVEPGMDTPENARLQRDIINELYKLAKESPLPDKALNVQKKDYARIMREILHNQDKYEGVWQDAREILGKRYKGDAEKMKVLEDYFDNFIVPVYSEDSMRMVLRDVMNELNLDVQDVLVANKNDRAKAKQEVHDALADKLGLDELDEQTVDIVTNDIFNSYDALLKEKAQKKLEKFLDDEVKDKKKGEPLKKQMLRMIRNGTFNEDEATRIVRQAYDVPTLTMAETREILNYYEQAESFAEGSYDRRKWEAKAQQIISGKTTKTFAEKNKAVRRIMMLLNPSTWERNEFGNIVFGSAEMLKNVPAGFIDMGVSKITGKRTTSANVFADMKAYGQGFARGTKEWKNDIKYGVDTSHSAVREEYQVSNSFSDKHWYGRMANKAENIMSKALQIGDRPFYEAAYDQRINELKRLGYDTASESVQAECKVYALERVYQNDSKISKALTDVRDRLGLFGHFLVPFTQTPGNLLDKCIDYSGAGGLARALYQIGAAKKTGVFDQKLFVDRLGRALTGLGTMVFGAFLASKGILFGTEDDDYEVSGAKRLAGEKEYSLRIGDHYYTIDWAQPVSAILIAGAEAHKAGMEQDDWMQIAIASGEGVINTLFAMSCLEGLESMMSSYGNAEPADKIADVFISGVSQYFPTSLRRLNNVIDPVQRQTYSPNRLIKQGKYILSGIPGASYLLDPKYTLEGDIQYKSQGRNIASRFAENFLSPANIGIKYSSEVNDELLRIYEKTGEKNQFLHYAQKKLDYGDSGKYVLSADDYNRMQKEIGSNTVKADKEFMRSSTYKNMSDDEKAEALGEIATFYDNQFKEEYAKKNDIEFNNSRYLNLKKKVADAGGWTGYFENQQSFSKYNAQRTADGEKALSYDTMVKYKETCDKYGINYTAYAESKSEIEKLKTANSASFKKLEDEGKKVKSSDKTEANKRAIAKYLAGRKDLTNPQKQVIWQEIYSGKSSESYISVARRCGFI